MTFHQSNTNSHEKKTLLCLDDDIIHLKILKRSLLKLFDINLITSTSSTEVLEYLKGHTVDMITQDIIRPEIDGWSFLEIMRMTDKLKDIPVLLITAMTFDEKFISEAERLNASYVLKHRSLTQLKEKILTIFPNITQCQIEGAEH